MISTKIDFNQIQQSFKKIRTPPQNKNNGIINKMDNFQIIKVLGEGSYGRVYKGKDQTTQEIVALKEIKFDDLSDGIPASTIREITILKELKNEQNILQLKETIYQPEQKKLVLVLEYIDQDLVINGVLNCHNKRIIHRDLKPQNILINSDLEIKIADFGLSKTLSHFKEKLTKEIQTLYYRAPELLLGSDKYSTVVDSWAIGCIMYELFTFKPLFQGECEVDQIFKIFQFFGTPNKQRHQELTHLKDFNPMFPKFEEDENVQKTQEKPSSNRQKKQQQV
ncbi:Protein kinase-like domain [Pseudocohnilembus persalinus]|uniref:Cyclin-dependent kinase 2 homolog n=1 Tax=Pseudocohnilembus persalinus TaxID=266149 RepID=A0A0V0R4R5_PSEPJ|nr:Protein kinase-like domain [Pseudocohnilembus persalinus]|eukprot:KRX09463.1 Protein kinase-like domain [Pseudocohnilembus persalinus]